MDPASRLSVPPWNTGITVIDSLLGGLPRGAITQLRGPSGSGKTALCTLLAVVAAREGTVAYVDADMAFSTERATQMGAGTRELDSILVGRPCDLAEQGSMVQDSLDAEGLTLLVVDSAVCHYRALALRERDEANARLAEHMSQLRRQAASSGVPVVVTNHVWRDRETGELQPVAGDILAYRSRCIVDVRRSGVGTSRRRLIVRKHPSIAEGRSVEATIAQDGVHPSAPGLLERLLGTHDARPDERLVEASST